MERRAFFLMVLTLVATRKLRFVKRRPFGPLFGYKSRFLTFSGFKTPHAHFTSRIDWFYAAKHDASSPGSSGVGPRRFPVWAVLVDLAHLAMVDSRAQYTVNNALKSHKLHSILAQAPPYFCYFRYCSTAVCVPVKMEWAAPAECSELANFSPFHVRFSRSSTRSGPDRVDGIPTRPPSQSVCPSRGTRCRR